MPTPPDRFCREVLLPDGRTLGYAEVGDPGGRPLVLMHGTPSSRFDAVLLDEPARRAGWRILAPDRPGIGRSSPLPGRTVLDWPDDVQALLDAAVTGPAARSPVALLGFSGGAPYALATAHRFPERVSMVAIVSGWGPPDRPGAYRGVPTAERLFDAVARRAPSLTRGALAATSAILRRIPALGAALLDRRVQLDRALDPFLESVRQGASGPTDDLRLIVLPWGFAVGAVEAPVHLWHGADDPEIPAHHAEFVARVVADSTLEIVADGDHMLLFTHADEILGALAERSA